nr:UUP1 family membrane protein [Kiloniellales bacterium]
MSARLQLYLIMSVLVALGLGLTAYKHLTLGFPMLPGAKEEIWIVQARIRFDATGEPAKVTLNLPDDTNDLVIVESGATAPGFGFSLEQGKSETRGVWSARAPSGRQSLYYQARIYRGPGEQRDLEDGEEAPPPPERPLFIERRAAAADAVLADAHARSADAVTLAVRLIRQFISSDPDENVSSLLRETEGQAERNQLLLDLLHSAEIPARPLRGIDLGEEGRRSSLVELIEVHDGKAWQVVDPRTGDTGMPWFFLPWQRGEQALFEVEGGKSSEIGFSVREDELAARNVALNLGRAQGAGVIDFSIYTLPVDIQNTFATLLLIPIGALVVVIL